MLHKKTVSLKKIISLTKAVPLLIIAATTMPAYADFAALIPQLTNPLEKQSAIAALKTYQDLIANAGCTDTMRAPAAAANGQAGKACSGSTYLLFRNVRAIVHTGNQLDGGGPTLFSLGLDKRGLGLALRWDAAEEYASQGSLSSGYLRGQMSSLSSRLSALRQGTQGFSFHASNRYTPDASDSGNNLISFSQNQSVPRGGSAGEDETYSALGGFINYSVGTGNKAPTNLEDAFDYDGYQVNAGMDYRLNDEWVTGALISIIKQRMDFDSARSTVSGNVETSGSSLVPFAMWQKNNFFVSASLTYQRMKFSSLRAIRYTSLNLDIPSPNTQAVATAYATTAGGSLGVGYDFNYKNLSLEPAINFNSASTSIDEFVERDTRGTAFDLVVGKQKISQNSTSAGLTVRYTFTPSFAVITPYATIEKVQQGGGKPNVIQSYYLNAASSTNTFAIPADEVDKSYQVNTFGLYSVVRGSRQTTAGGTFSGGVQIFLQVKNIVGLQNYTSNVKEVGVRYEF